MTAEKFLNIFKILQFTEVLREEIDPEIPANQISLILWVAIRPGMSQAELAKLLKMPESQMSRTVAKLELKTRVIQGLQKEYGLGLIESRRDDPKDNRKKCLYMTPKGEEVVQKFEKALYSATG